MANSMIALSEIACAGLIQKKLCGAFLLSPDGMCEIDCAFFICGSAAVLFYCYLTKKKSTRYRSTGDAKSQLKLIT